MSKRCVFCDIVHEILPSSRVYEDDHVIAFLDIFPLRPGHLLVIPRDHHQHAHELSSKMRAHLFDVGVRMAETLKRSRLAPAAVHYAINDGPAAHQSVPHVHMHVLPRYHDDVVRFLLRMLRKPIDPILGPTARSELDELAAHLRSCLP